MKTPELKVTPIKKNGRNIAWRVDIEGKKSQLFFVKNLAMREMTKVMQQGKAVCTK